jgi:Uma2 family endonuclease
VKTKDTVEDLYHVRGKAELINGEIALFPPQGAMSNIATGGIRKSLDNYKSLNGGGYVLGGTAAFIVDLPHRQSLSPDAAWWIGEVTMKFCNGAPIFAAEVRSEGDYGKTAEDEIAAKRRDYFATGTLVVWDVDLLSHDAVRVYRASEPDQPTVYRRGEIAEAEPAVPGWRFPVDELFR